MPRRFLSRRSRTGGSYRNAMLRVWTAAVTDFSTANNTQINTVLADAASFATTAGNTKHIGTLVRIRGCISVIPGTPGGSTNLGIHISDVGETIQSPATAAFGQDEDLIYWCRKLHPTATTLVEFDLDIKAKRRLDVEQQVMLSFIHQGMAANSVMLGNVRCLFLVP